MQKAMTLQVSPSCPCSLSTSPSRGDTQADSWCSCCSYQPVMATEWHHSEERRSTQKGLPSCAIGTTLPGKKNEGFQPFENPKGFSSTFLQVERLGRRLTEPSSSPPSPPTAGSLFKRLVYNSVNQTSKLPSPLTQLKKIQLRELETGTVSDFTGRDLAAGRTSLNQALKAVRLCPMKEELRSGLQGQCYLNIWNVCFQLTKV